MAQLFLFLRKVGLINAFFILATISNIYGFGYLFGYVAIVLIFFKKNFLIKAMERNFFLLFLFSITYSLFYALNPWKGLQYVLLYMLTPPAFYLWGKYLAQINVRTKVVFYVLIAITILYSLPAMVSVLLDIKNGGFVQIERNIPMFWTSVKTPATQMASFFVFNMCTVPLLLISYKTTPKSLNIFLLIVFLLSTLCVLRLGSRTLLGIMFLSIVIGLFFATPKMSLKENLTVYGLLFVIIFGVASQISLDIDSDLFTSFAGRMKDNGTEDLASGGGRTSLWSKSWDNLFEKPLGWDLEEFGYSHNLWFDALRVGGIIPFVILILYSIRALNLIRKIITSKLIPLEFQNICLLYAIAFFSQFMVEPGIDGTFSLFILFCLFVGLIRQHYTDTVTENVEIT